MEAELRLQSVIENPGPFSELSNMPLYILVGQIDQFVSDAVGD